MFQLGAVRGSFPKDSRKFSIKEVLRMVDIVEEGGMSVG